MNKKINHNKIPSGTFEKYIEKIENEMTFGDKFKSNDLKNQNNGISTSITNSSILTPKTNIQNVFRENNLYELELQKAKLTRE